MIVTLLTALPPKIRRIVYAVLALAGFVSTSFGDVIPHGWPAKLLAGLSALGLTVAAANVTPTVPTAQADPATTQEVQP